jgi:hypothetical protein
MLDVCKPWDCALKVENNLKFINIILQRVLVTWTYLSQQMFWKIIMFLGFETFNVNLKVVDAIELI